jgi:L-alanine-DL-glutamate epimerase-like enolase superfamily enzyme
MTGSIISRVELLSMPVHDGGVPVVRLSDGDGLVGYGEALGDWDELPEATEALSLVSLGRPTAAREALYQSLAGAVEDWDDSPALAHGVLSAFDCAAWDLLGRELGVPCCVLTGGATRSRLEVCAACGHAADEGALERAKKAHGRGVRTFAFELESGSENQLEGLRAIRRKLGTDVLLAARILQPAANAPAARELGLALDKVDPYWVAGLLPDGQWTELGQVRQGIISPTAAGAGTYGVKRFFRAVESGCADILTPGLLAVGGGIPALRVMDAAWLRGIRATVLPGQSLASLRAASHLCFARSHAGPLMIPVEQLEPMDVRDGFVDAPQGPGLGVPESWAQSLESVAEFGG